MMDRRELVQRLLADRGDLLVVSGLGSATYDVAARGDHPLNFYLWGAMGGTAMIGLGLALARPDRRVLVLTGDGEALMGMGSLATIGVKQPRNLVIVILDNATTARPACSRATPMPASTSSPSRSPAASSTRARSPISREAAEVRSLIHSGEGPILVSARIKREDAPRVLPTRDGHAIKLRFMQALSAG